MLSVIIHLVMSAEIMISLNKERKKTKMANYVLALFFAGRGVVHLLNDDEMLWWDIIMVVLNVVLGAM
jgi:uncharacterized membrane protein